MNPHSDIKWCTGSVLGGGGALEFAMFTHEATTKKKRKKRLFFEDERECITCRVKKLLF